MSPLKIGRGKHTLLAVVHAEDAKQALRNAKRARNGGADGVFLINHDTSYRGLLRYYEQVRAEMPDFWIGLNCLDLGTDAIEVIPHNAQGLWVDNAGVGEGDTPGNDALKFAKQRKAEDWDGTYFGGVAFKYQEEVSDVARAARLAVPLVDVITTSGPGTGMAADLIKIKTMREAIGDHPLAIASGITAGNVHLYLPYVDCFLVASGISDSYSELNESRVQELVAALGR